MKCQEIEEDCNEDAVGEDTILKLQLCRKHLAFSIMVHKLCNAALDNIGHPELIPAEYRFPPEIGENN